VTAVSELVAWHDAECASYTADLPLWRALAEETGGPVLDVGAGTGRVALDLARAGVEVVALDVEPELLAALRARDARVETVAADARDFDAGHERFGLVIAPMQTVQLLGGPDGRRGFLRSAARALRPGGLLACALANALEGVDADDFDVPHPDRLERDGVVWESWPTAIRDDGDGFVLERRRVRRAGGRGDDASATTQRDVLRLDRVTAALLAVEGAAAGLHAQAPRSVPATADHVGSEVAVLRRA
jgi:SAM-dependent methyltransferase